MKPLYETCDGCRSLRENQKYNNVCVDIESFKYDNDRVKTCPCAICIVKSTCWQGCDDFNNFIMEMHGLSEREKDEEKARLEFKLQTHAGNSNDSGRDAKTMRPCKLCR